MNIEKNPEQLDTLLEAAMMLLEKQKEKNEEYAGQTRREFISLLAGMKQELTEFSRENIKTELDSVLKGYVSDMEEVRQKMIEQSKEFNSYLYYVNKKNKQLVFRSWLAVSVSLVLLLTGGIWMGYYYSQIISQNKSEAEVTQLIGQSDLVRCGDNLCVKTGKVQKDGYRAVLKR